MTTKKKAQAVLACMFLISGLLIVISAVGGAELETIPFYKFMLSIFIGLCLMCAGCGLADGVKK